MPRLAFVTLTFALILTLPTFAADRGNHYSIKSEINPDARTIRASATIEVSVPSDGNSLRFLLNKSLTVTKVDCAACEGFRFATTEPPGFRYVTAGAPLYVRLNRTAKAGERLKVKIAYEGPLSASEWPVNMLGPDWTELAVYIGWYPMMPEMGNFTYELDVTADKSYVVTGEGVVNRRSSGHWHISQQMKTSDIVVIAAKGLKTLALADRPSLGLQYGSANEPAAAEHVHTLMETAVIRYTSWFGPFRGGQLTLVLTNRGQGGGYVRPGFVSLQKVGPITPDSKRQLTNGIGHEIAHLWWFGAPATTWEDWLNESFAEYSSWLLVKDQCGNEEFDKLVATAREHTKGKPAIWGIDRNADDSYVVLYEKGALLLNDLASEMGDKAFQELLTQAANTETRSTSDFLTKLEKMTTRQTREHFEQALRN